MDTSAARLLQELGNLLPRQENTAKIEVNAGSIGVWIAATACIVMAAMLAIAVPVGVGAYLALKADVRELDDSDDAIRAYINTGILKPKPEKERAD